MLKQVIDNIQSDSYIFAQDSFVGFLKVADDKEFAPGIRHKENISIPSHIDKPILTNYVIQEHDALKAGKHFDLRIKDPIQGIALSWTLRNLPKESGEKRLAIAQAVHTPEYMAFSGTISEGTYGAGKVSIKEKGDLEILESNPDKINFAIYKGKEEELYSLIKTQGNKWLLLNRTLTREKNKDIPDNKLKFENIDWKDFDYKNNDQLLQTKIDGASALIILKENQPIQITSWKPVKTKSGFMAYHSKFKNFFPIKTPAKLKNTILRGEVAFKDKDNRIIPVEQTAGILNSSILKARDTIEKKNLTPSIYLWDIEQHTGKDMAETPYKIKFDLIKEIAKEIPQFSIPDTAETADEKLRLVKDIEGGTNKLTREGAVIRELNQPEKKIKRSKIKATEDRLIVDIEESKINPASAGAFWYANSKDAKPLGKVTIAKPEIKKDAIKNPEKYINKWVMIEHMGVFPSGALRNPVFKDFHFEKNLT